MKPVEFSTSTTESLHAAIEQGVADHYADLTAHTINEKAHILSILNDGHLTAGVVAYHHGTILWVDSVYVAKNHRHQGLGRALIDRLIEDANRLGAQELQLNTYFPEAADFFKAVGFETVAVLPNWKYGLPCYFMRKPL